MRACYPVQSRGMGGVPPQSVVPRPYYIHIHSVAGSLRAWDTLTMFEATVCGRS